MPGYLTKSRFALGCECPSRIFYDANPRLYANAAADDIFLQGLAEGGFQVGELARTRLCNHPANDTILGLDHDKALAETARRLQARDVTIAEAAFRHQNLFIRADVVRKRGATIELYEVKSKAWDREAKFWQVRNPDKPDSGWMPYLLDVAFQQYVVEQACPGMKVKAFLVLVDKGKVATVDGLNQAFKITRAGGRTQVAPVNVAAADLGDDILAYVPVDSDVAKVRQLEFPAVGPPRPLRFAALVEYLSGLCAGDRQVFCGVGARCKSCGFRYSSDPEEREEQGKSGLRSGFEECWRKALGRRFVPGKPSVLEIWNFRRADDLVSQGKYYLADLARADLGDGKLVERQWRQVEKAQRNDSTPWLDRPALRAEVQQWKFPLHFIDFETSRVAIPFHRGRHPYEQVAFQFSHHRVDADGRISHAGEWIEATPGRFPNFEFVRALKRELEADGGTILRYAAHENSVLNDIARQLDDSTEPDRQALCKWIASVTSVRGAGRREVRGSRCMIDMCRLVKEMHYDPYTHGSNSLKHVLPAIIHSSSRLRDKYSRPVYGTREMPGRNYSDWAWIRSDCGGDPYRALPPLFTDEEGQAVSEHLEDFAGIAQGGEAMMAYAKLQFMDLPAADRARLVGGLLKYCELDTLAMVMLYEYWKQECGL